MYFECVRYAFGRRIVTRIVRFMLNLTVVRVDGRMKGQPMTSPEFILAHNGDRREIMHYNDVEDQP